MQVHAPEILVIGACTVVVFSDFLFVVVASHRFTVLPPRQFGSSVAPADRLFYPPQSARDRRRKLVEPSGFVQIGELFVSGMSMNIQEQVGEQRAAVLLGLPTTELRRFSRLSGLGHLEKGDRGEQVVFTYEELRRLCLLAAQSSK